jgi:hypothetical protein
MAIQYNQQTDSDFRDWLSRIVAVGEVPNKNNITAVGVLVNSLKSQALWPKMKEIYILAGVTNFNSIFQKLKYITWPTLTNSGFISTDYTVSGINAGLASNVTAKQLFTSVQSTDLASGNRSLGVYETKRASATGFYSTLMGRPGGGGNTAFGPDVIQSSNVSEFRFMDTTVPTSRSIVGTLDVPAGFFAGSESSGLATMRASNTVSSGSYTPGTLNGASAYNIGGSIGGGGWSASTISFGFMGTGLSVAEMATLDSIVNTLMISLACNIY